MTACAGVSLEIAASPLAGKRRVNIKNQRERIISVHSRLILFYFFSAPLRLRGKTFLPFFSVSPVCSVANFFVSLFVAKIFCQKPVYFWKNSFSFFHKKGHFWGTFSQKVRDFLHFFAKIRVFLHFSTCPSCPNPAS